MNIFVKQALLGIIKILIGKDTWVKVQTVVDDMQSHTELTGEEKRAMVIAAIKESGWTLAGSLLNLAIEIAVTFLSAEATSIGGK